MNAFVLVLLIAAVILAAVEAVRARNFGWAAIACIALAFVVASGAVRIADS